MQAYEVKYGRMTGVVEPRPQHPSHRYPWKLSRLSDTLHSSRCLFLPTSSLVLSTPLEFPNLTVAQVAPDLMTVTPDREQGYVAPGLSAYTARTAGLQARSTLRVETNPAFPLAGRGEHRRRP